LSSARTDSEVDVGIVTVWSKPLMLAEPGTDGRAGVGAKLGVTPSIPSAAIEPGKLESCEGVSH
jgi:hypothetical protein